MGFASLFSAAIRKRASLKAVSNAMRLVNGIGDGMEGLILDQYGQHFSTQVFDPKWIVQAREMTDALTKEFRPAFFIMKDRTLSASARPDVINHQVLIGSKDKSTTVVKEYGLKFSVDLNDGLNAGLFLDMRQNRNTVGESAKDKRILNCFAYTCSFGVHARKHGALEVVNVDVSKRALERGQANYTLNGIAAGANEFVRADAGMYLERAAKKNNYFDIIVLDPPSFARSEGKVFQVKKDLPQMLAKAIRVLNPGGQLFVSSNFNGLRHEDLEDMVRDACPERKLLQSKRISQDIDFVGSNRFKESYLVGVWVLFH